MRLATSLQSQGTGWCTAGTRTAAHQLSRGDFYVYYTRDNSNEDTIPRVAIRMEDGLVAEVRGVESNQHLEANMIDIASEKLAALPGGDEYQKAVADMRRLKDIDERIRSGAVLTTEDIIFLRFSGDINGFGQDTEDPRVKEFLKGRDEQKDLIAVLEAGYGTEVLQQCAKSGKMMYILENLDIFMAADTSIEPSRITTALIERLPAEVICQHVQKLVSYGVDPAELAYKLIKSGWAGSVVKYLNDFISAGADINPDALIKDFISNGKLSISSIIKSADTLRAAGMSYDVSEMAQMILEREDRKGIDRRGLKALWESGAVRDVNRLVFKAIENPINGGLFWAESHLDDLLKSGLDPAQLAIDVMNSHDSYDRQFAQKLEFLTKTGVDTIEMAKQMTSSGKLGSSEVDSFLMAGMTKEVMIKILEDANLEDLIKNSRILSTILKSEVYS